VSEKPTAPDLAALMLLWVEAFNRCDFEAIAATCAPDAVWDASLLGLAGPFEGRNTIRRAWEDWSGTFETSRLVSEELRELGNSVTFAVAVEHSRPKGASRFLEARYALVVTWADGLIERMTTYTDIDQARGAAERLAEERG
jgi:ketosteroid isomerase-like protein